MKSSERYRQMARDMAEFRDAYLAVLSHMKLSKVAFQTIVRPKESHEDEANEAISSAARLAGRAKYAQEQSGIPALFTTPALGSVYNAVTSWDHSLRDPDAMPPTSAVNMYEAIIGALEEKADRAARTERSFAGRLASFVSLPARVRSIVEEQHPSYGRAAAATGVFTQLVIGVAIILLGTAATAGVTGLWKHVLHSSPAPAKSSQPVAPVPGPATPASPAAPTPVPSRT